MERRVNALGRALADGVLALLPFIFAGIAIAAIALAVLASLGGAGHLAPTRWTDSIAVT